MWPLYQQTYRINKEAAQIAKKACQEVQEATGNKCFMQDFSLGVNSDPCYSKKQSITRE